MTNNSSARVAEQEAALAAIGIPATGDVLTSAMAGGGARRARRAGARVRRAGRRRGASTARGAVAVPVTTRPARTVDAVIVGFHREFDYERMRIAATAVRRGARFIATNDDATYPDAGRADPRRRCDPRRGRAPRPGATPVDRRQAVRSRWPPPCATLLGGVARRRGCSWSVTAPSTDGAFAVTLGCPFALVRTGVTPPGDAGRRADAAVDAADLAAVVDSIARRSDDRLG